MSSLLDSLPSFAGGTQTWMAAPFSVKVGRLLWSAATDGAWLVGIQGKSFSLKDHAEVATYLSAPIAKPSHEVSTTKLRAWAGEVPTARRFEKVDDARLGSLFDLVVDLRRLACLLQPVPFETLRVWKSSSAVVGLASKGWRALLAGIDWDVEPGISAFEFHTPSDLELMQRMLGEE